MKIKLHNSLSKKDAFDDYFLFDDKISIDLREPNIYLKYRINDSCYFLYFSCKRKEFGLLDGFGHRHILSPGWWKNRVWKWREMSE